MFKKYYVFVLQLLTAVKKALIQGKRESTTLVRSILAGEFMMFVSRNFFLLVHVSSMSGV